MRQERTKRENHSVKYYTNALNNEKVRTDHPLQRESDQWSTEYRDGLIGTVLKEEDIPYIVICEQIIGDVVKNYLIDGIQRITTIYNYRMNVFKIGNNVENPFIEYEVVKKDKSGNPVRDKNGELIHEIEIFDIRGKYYKDLPEELQERFDEYSIYEIKHLNCSDERIGYEIRRYNHAKRMGACQAGKTYLDTSVAKRIRSITDGEFFKDKVNFNKSEKKNDTATRVVCESIMATYFLDNWKAQLKGICSFLNDNVRDYMFDDLNEEIEELSNVLDKTSSQMLTSKDSFLWLTTYHKFRKYGLKSEKFVDFMNEFNANLHNNKYNGETFDKLNEVSTKKKNCIIKKLELMEYMMKQFLHIEDIEMTTEEFIAKNVELSIEEVRNDIEVYEETLDDLKNQRIKDGSRLLHNENMPSMLAMVAYSYKHDIDLDEWMEEFAAKNNTYIADQHKNFLHMLRSFTAYYKTIAQ